MTELIALCAPWVILILFLVTVGFAFFKKCKCTIGLLLLAIVGNWYFECFPLHIPISSADESGQTIKVLSFNCNLSPSHKNYYKNKKDVIDLILLENPDIVFLTENFILNRDSLWFELSSEYIFHTQKNKNVGNFIYSKYPIIKDTLSTDSVFPYGITYCTIDYKGTSINVIGCHLSSNNYNEHHEYMTPDSVENSQQSKAYLRNVMDASRYREDEARELVNMLAESNYPCIVMGDMNDVAGSPAMRVLAKAGFKDAWWENGFGYGATIRKPLPYRIDHVLYRDAVVSGSTGSPTKGSKKLQKVSCGLRLKSIKKIDSNGLSDHDALVAEFSLE